MAEGLTEGYADVFPDFHRARLYLDSVVGDIPSKMAINDSAHGFWILRLRILKDVKEVQEFDVVPPSAPPLPQKIIAEINEHFKDNPRYVFHNFDHSQDGTSFIPTCLSNFINPDTGRERREEIAAGSSSSCAMERQNSHSAVMTEEERRSLHGREIDLIRDNAQIERLCPFDLAEFSAGPDWFRFWDDDNGGYLTRGNVVEALCSSYPSAFSCPDAAEAFLTDASPTVARCWREASFMARSGLRGKILAKAGNCHARTTANAL
jgi:hypothetical protein